jgi:hypothetical protein
MSYIIDMEIGSKLRSPDRPIRGVHWCIDLGTSNDIFRKKLSRLAPLIRSKCRAREYWPSRGTRDQYLENRISYILHSRIKRYTDAPHARSDSWNFEYIGTYAENVLRKLSMGLRVITFSNDAFP